MKLFVVIGIELDVHCEAHILIGVYSSRKKAQIVVDTLKNLYDYYDLIETDLDEFQTLVAQRLTSSGSRAT